MSFFSLGVSFILVGGVDAEVLAVVGTGTFLGAVDLIGQIHTGRKDGTNLDLDGGGLVLHVPKNGRVFINVKNFCTTHHLLQIGRSGKRPHP
jgi:hypothetical protein